MNSKDRIKSLIFGAFVLGMVQTVLIHYIPREWMAPYFSFVLLIDVILMGLWFRSIDNLP